MKKPALLLILLFFFLSTSAQQNFNGTWKGTMIQDSPKRSIDFEIVLEEKEGKITGYLYRLFIVNDTLIYNTVRIQARVVNNTLVVEDEKSVSKNFEDRADRIKVVYFFKLDKNEKDSLAGEWTTNRYKKYMAITGTAAIAREPNYLTTQIYKRLEEKKLHLGIAFTVKQKTEPGIVSAPVKTETPTNPKVDTVQTITSTAGTEVKPIEKKPDVVIQNKPNASTIQPKPEPSNSSVAINKPSVPVQNIPVTNPPVVQNQQKPPSSSVPPVTQKPVVTKPIVKPPAQQQPTSAGKNPPPIITQAEKPAVEISKTNQAQVHDSAIAIQTAVPVIAPTVINNPVITKRETEIIQALAVYEDSVTFSLYDNGEIDGDTVSVFLNNEKIVSKVGLTASAFKKTIYFTPGQTVQLTLFAENLGTIPPNTGLLVVYSGDKRYQVFFTSTLNKSAVILLKRE